MGDRSWRVFERSVHDLRDHGFEEETVADFQSRDLIVGDAEGLTVDFLNEVLACCFLTCKHTSTSVNTLYDGYFNTKFNF